MSKYPNTRIKKTLVVDVSEDNNSVLSEPFEINGRIRRAVIVVPDLDSTNTATLVIKDEDGFTVYTDSAVAENSTANETTDIAVAGQHTIEITTSGNQTADRTFTVVLLVDRG